MNIPPLSRKQKLIRALENFEGCKCTAKEIINWMNEKWSKTGFDGPKSLGLYLRRYRFDKKGARYVIDQDKIEKRKDIEGEW